MTGDIVTFAGAMIAAGMTFRLVFVGFAQVGHLMFFGAVRDL